jgi:hypothetical protein
MALSKVDLANQVENQLPQNLVANNLPFRNIIINGDMSIAQRATSATGLGNGDAGYHTVDRYRFSESGSPTAEFTQSQSTDVPTGQGFGYSLKMDCTTAQASIGVDDSIYIEQRIEGQNLQYLKKGTSNAESLTVSFWVKSSVTGDYSTALYDNTNTRIIGSTYTISTADTWEKKTITFAGDTTGTLVNTNVQALRLWFALLAGTNRSNSSNTSWQSFSDNGKQAFGQTANLADSTSNEWYITGVQLEVGSAASDFEFLPVDVNLERCQRYYQKSFDIGTAPAQNIGIQTGELSFPSTKGSSTATTISQKYNFPVRMRASPTMTGYNSNSANSQVRDVTASADCSSTSFASNKETGFYVSCTTSSSTSVGNYLSIHFTASAEL